MAMTTEKTQGVPMSVRMRRVLTAVKRMAASERFHLLVKAGLMTEAQAQEAVNRQIPPKKVRRKNKK